jgi:hypothetical protein
VGVSANGNNLTKTASTRWGNAGAVSTQTLPSADGLVEITASETNTYRYFGLSHGDSNQTQADIDFSLYLLANGTLQIYEQGGKPRGSFGTYVTGDKLQVSVESGVVKYKKNGTVLYTSSVAPTYPLLVDTAFYTQGSTLNGGLLSGNWQ